VRVTAILPEGLSSKHIGAACLEVTGDATIGAQAL
jgi:hypothetical protein